MSNPEKKPMNVAEEITEKSENNDSSCSIEDGEIREEVLALPALSVNERSDVDEKIHKEAVIAAQLIVKAAKEAAEKKTEQTVSVTGDVSGSPESKKSKRPLGNLLANLPPGNIKSICPVCWKEFRSMNAVYGHMRLHKGRGCQGSLPLLTFHAAEEGLGKDIASSSSGGGLGIDLNVKLEEDEEEEGSGSQFSWKFDLNKEPQDEEDEGKVDEGK